MRSSVDVTIQIWVHENQPGSTHNDALLLFTLMQGYVTLIKLTLIQLQLELLMEHNLFW